VTEFGVETSQWAKAFMTPGDACYLELGVERRDVYDRLLAYLWRRDGAAWRMYNREAIERGFSPYFTKYGFSPEHHDELAAAQVRAQEGRLGIWDPDNAGLLRGAYLGAEGLLELWEDRARALESFAAQRGTRPDIIELRSSYAALARHVGERVTVFTAVRTPKSEGGEWIGKCEGKPREPFAVVAKGPELEAALGAVLERYRYFTGVLERDKAGYRLLIDDVGDVSATPPPRS
jgi:hypothetical protein